MKKDIDNTLLTIHAMIRLETPERGASIEDRIKSYHRRKAMQEVADVLADDEKAEQIIVDAIIKTIEDVEKTVTPMTDAFEALQRVKAGIEERRKSNVYTL